MLRRLYLLFPKKSHIEHAVQELQDIGINTERMHTIARDDVDISGLPTATKHQKGDFSATLEHVIWNLNLALFFIAMAFFIYAVFQSSWIVGLFSLFIMAGTLYMGNYFVSHVPHMHLDQFQGALAHKEILLMVDVPHWRIRHVDKLIRKRHPEGNLDGVGWAVEAFGI